MKARLLALICLLFIIFAFKNWDIPVRSLGHFYYQNQNKVPENFTYHSQIETFYFQSQAFPKIKKRVKVYLPYNSTSSQTNKLPALYLLHGYPGSDDDWLKNTHLQQKLDQLIQNQELPPLIVIFPEANGPVIHDSQYLNATLIKQPVEDYLIELVRFIDSKYPVINNRLGRAIGGLSSGAYGAVNLGLRHNDLFAYVISHSGYLINREFVTNRLIGKDQTTRQNLNPLEYINNINLSPQTFIYFDVGGKDNPKLIQENQQFNEFLNQKNIPHQFNLTSGGHSWTTWNNNITLSLKFLGQQLKNNLYVKI